MCAGPRGVPWYRLRIGQASTSGMRSCTVLTPMLPLAALSPRAKPFSRSGKKNEMLAMLEAKLPPPRPAVAAAAAMSQNGVSGRVTKNAREDVGTKSNNALTIVQLRPPKRGTAKVYGKRMRAPTSPGRATSENSWSVVYGKPAFGSRVATTLQMSQTEKPRFSARIDHHRFRRAMRLPLVCQNVASSGFQVSIQRGSFGRLFDAISHRYAPDVSSAFRRPTMAVKPSVADLDRPLTLA